MALQPKDAVRASSGQAGTDSIWPSDPPLPPDLPLFRFGLRHLLLFVAGLSALLTAIVVLKGLPALALLLAALVVTFHVLGTAVGSELRLRTNRRQQHAAASFMANESAATVLGHSAPPPILSPAPVPWLSQNGASFAWIIRLVATAMFFGGCVGALFLTATLGNRTSLTGIAVGSVSIAVVTGWLAFLACSFYSVFRHGLREATSDD